MKSILISFFVLASFAFFGQQASEQKADSAAIMTFTCVFLSNVSKADGFPIAKDGYCRVSKCSIAHPNNFLISVPDDIAKEFDREKVKISGTYQLVIGVKNLQRKDSTNSRIEPYQGLEENSFLFISPKIELLRN